MLWYFCIIFDDTCRTHFHFCLKSVIVASMDFVISAQLFCLLLISSISFAWCPVKYVLISPLGIPKDSCFRALPLFFICFEKSLLALRSENQRMYGSWYVTKSWEYGVVLISRDWIPRLVPFEKMGKLPQISPKIYRCLCSPTCRNQTAQHVKTKTKKRSFERGIIALHFPFTHSWGNVADSLYKFYLRASVALLSFARWHRRYRADSALLWKMRL